MTSKMVEAEVIIVPHFTNNVIAIYCSTIVITTIIEIRELIQLCMSYTVTVFIVSNYLVPLPKLCVLTISQGLLCPQPSKMLLGWQFFLIYHALAIHFHKTRIVCRSIYTSIQ